MAHKLVTPKKRTVQTFLSFGSDAKRSRRAGADGMSPDSDAVGAPAVMQSGVDAGTAARGSADGMSADAGAADRNGCVENAKYDCTRLKAHSFSSLGFTSNSSYPKYLRSDIVQTLLGPAFSARMCANVQKKLAFRDLDMLIFLYAGAAPNSKMDSFKAKRIHTHLQLKMYLLHCSNAKARRDYNPSGLVGGGWPQAVGAVSGKCVCGRMAAIYLLSVALALQVSLHVWIDIVSLQVSLHLIWMEDIVVHGHGLGTNSIISFFL